jgi:hypothetical protein
LAPWALAVLIRSVASFDFFVVGIELGITRFQLQQLEQLEQQKQHSTDPERYAAQCLQQLEGLSLPALSVGLPVYLRLLDEVLQNVLALVPVLLPVALRRWAQQPAPSISSSASTDLDAAASEQRMAEQCLYVLP